MPKNTTLVWFTLLLIVCAFPLTVTAEPHSEPQQQQGLDAVVEQTVWLRSGPGVEWRQIRQLEPGTRVRLDGRPGVGDFWVRGITQGGEIGWMAAQYLSVTSAQVNSLPTIWVDTPFTLSPPSPGGAPQQPAQPPAEQPAAPAEQPGQAPAEQPAEQPAAPPPVANTAPVGGFNLGGHISTLNGRTIDALRRSGMTWIKRQVGDNGNAAGAINEAHSNGFRILLGVVGRRDLVSDDNYLQQYANTLAGMAAAGADAIEVWNEPNIDREWASGQISPQRYTQMLRLAYNAIKAANPNTLVVSGAPAPTGFFGGCSGAGCDDDAFVRGMAAAGAANYMDCVGIHYNEGIVPPDQTSGDPRGNSGHYSRYFWGMVNTYWNAFNGARPLCFTELGYLSPEGFGPLPGAFGWAADTSVAEHAAWLDRAVTLSRTSGRVQLVIVWNVDFTNYGADPMAGYAMIRPNGSCPACDALAN
ncbi:MAG: SH3 domain-containing protein [Chloroflexi bacterium]|nr:SH3 domain-containing protein [Chloroflexota bacterium]